ANRSGIRPFPKPVNTLDERRVRRAIRPFIFEEADPESIAVRKLVVDSARRLMGIIGLIDETGKTAAIFCAHHQFVNEAPGLRQNATCRDTPIRKLQTR